MWTLTTRRADDEEKSKRVQYYLNLGLPVEMGSLRLLLLQEVGAGEQVFVEEVEVVGI